MLNISFRSRVFSTDTLMDGEAVIGTHDYENMDEKQLQAELARLEERNYKLQFAHFKCCLGINTVRACHDYNLFPV